MDHFSVPTSHRRGFLARLGASLAALAGGGALSSTVLAQSGQSATSGAPAPAARGPWDDTWTTRLTGQHRMVFDAPEIAEGLAISQARTFTKGYEEALGKSGADVNAVLVFRHGAVPMAMGDTLWDRYGLGKELNLKDPTTGEPACRNPFMNYRQGDRHWMVWPDGGLDALMARGATLLVCDLALRGFSSRTARRLERPVAEVREEIRAGLVPGAVVLPSGIYAVARAQECGCQYIRSA